MRGKKRSEKMDMWKTIRARRKTLDMMRTALKANPIPESFEPYFNVETVSDSHVFDIAGSLAVRHITGKLFEEWFGLFRPEFERLLKVAQQYGAEGVAAHFGATIRPEKDGKFSIVMPNREDATLPTLQAPTVPATMFH